ncbi:MAG: riboflavin synthase [Alphaproteobacteria bacterium]|nr:riboflavin synthase [Alphaproteobacteria bacterium]
MFTGIITHLGKISALKSDKKKDLLLKISVAGKIDRKLTIGCSVALNGICLTLVSKEKNILSFQASKETYELTSLSRWQVGQVVNVEFALRAGDEFGGHFVLGHVDGTALIKEIKPVKDSKKFVFEVKKDLLKFIVRKGSITLDGVSLTVNEVNKNTFSINLIPHTITYTTFKHALVEDLVNLEIDVIARYLNQKSKI